MAQIEKLTGSNPLKILIAAPEMAPFAKAGELGDVISAISGRMSLAGNDVKVFMPKYSSVYQTGIAGQTSSESLTISINGVDYPLRWETYQDKSSGLDIVFVINDDLYHRPNIYTDCNTGLDYDDNDVRYIFLCRAVLEITKQMDWRPDVIHSNEWQTALLPVYLKTLYADDSFFTETLTLLTFQNVASQGVFKKESLLKLGIPSHYLDDPTVFTARGQMNILKAGIRFADKINTVSERYATEVQTVEYGYGLQRALRERNADLMGTLNGVDFTDWNPGEDELVAQKFDNNHLALRTRNKSALQREVGLPVRNKHALISMVATHDDQSGVELFLDVAEDIFKSEVQLVVFGDNKYATELEALQKSFPKQFRFVKSYDQRLLHLFMAGSDMFLMPARSEPCGVNQMYALRYGAVPIVRETGGLADSIIECNTEQQTGSGFIFKAFSSDELFEALTRAQKLYAEKPDWRKLQKRCMTQDFSWNTATSRYQDFYRTTCAAKDTQRTFKGATAV